MISGLVSLRPAFYALALSAGLLTSAALAEEPKLDVIYVPTPQDVVDRMLTTVASASTRNLEALLKLRAPNALLLAYGGALHNDLAPRKGREQWSFGPRIAEVTRGKYVELDLIVPEYVKDTDSWRAFPWYSAYSQVKGKHGALLYTLAPHSFVLIFPRTS